MEIESKSKQPISWKEVRSQRRDFANRKRTGRNPTAKFMMVVDIEKLKILDNIALLKGCNVQELFRTVIIPYYLENHNLEGKLIE